MKPVITLIIKYSLILSVTLIAIWWLLFFSPFGIPEYIPGTPIKFNGALMSIAIIATSIGIEKEFIRLQPNVSFIRLALAGTIISFVSEMIFKIVSSIATNDNTFYSFLRGVFVITIFGAIISSLIAFQLKTKRTGQLILIIITASILISVINQIWTL
jgi:hypothetical protein